MVIRGKVVGTAEPVTVEVEGATISAVGDGPAPVQALGEEDVWISPAIFDVQVNGAGGISYSAGGPDGGPGAGNTGVGVQDRDGAFLSHDDDLSVRAGDRGAGHPGQGL